MNTWPIREICEVILLRAKALVKAKRSKLVPLIQQLIQPAFPRTVSSDSPAEKHGEPTDRDNLPPQKKRRQRRRADWLFTPFNKESTDEENNDDLKKDNEITLSIPTNGSNSHGLSEENDDAKTKISPEKEKRTTPQVTMSNAEPYIS